MSYNDKKKREPWWVRHVVALVIAVLGVFGGALIEVQTGAITTIITNISVWIGRDTNNPSVTPVATLQPEGKTSTPQPQSMSTPLPLPTATRVINQQPFSGVRVSGLYSENINCAPSSVEDGNLYTFNTSGKGKCVLGLDTVGQRWQNLKSFEARVQIGNVQSSEEMTQGLYLHAPNWYVFCGLTSYGYALLAGPEITNGLQNRVREELSVNLTSSHVFRMEIFPDTNEVRCWKDGEFVGDINVSGLDLNGAIFHRTIGSDRPEDSSGTTYVSDILSAR